MPRIVIDTNVVVSHMLIPGSVPDQAVRKAIAAGEALSTRTQFRELGEVLLRSKFDRYQTPERSKELFSAYVETVILVPTLVTVTACRDPRDNHILEAAINGRADTIITGDVDLLELDPFHGVRIVTPEEYLRTA